MLSRRAKLTYWMSRYLERSNFTSRLLTSTNELQIDLYLNDEVAWKPLLVILGTTKDFSKNKKEINKKNIMTYFISNKLNSSSVLSCLSYAKENSLIIRDRLPEQSIIKINELLISFNNSISKNLNKNNYVPILKNVIQGSQNFMYSSDLEMQRDTDYQFLKLGRYIERSDMMIRILQTQILRSKEHSKNYEYLTLEWINILKSISAFQAYRHYSKNDISISDIINFFLKTETFPRSIMWNLNQIERAFFRITKNKEFMKEIKNIKKDIKKYVIKIEKLDNLLLFLEQTIKRITNLDKKIEKRYFS
jgi:uncharacterized alpha-E superfamily protein